MDLEPSQVSALSPDLSLGARASFEHLSSLTGSPVKHLTGGFLDTLTSLRPLSLPTRGFGEARGKVRSQPRAGQGGRAQAGEAEVCDSPGDLNGFS